MRLHIIQYHLTVFLDDGAPARDFDPGIVDLFCRIPQHRKSHLHGDAVAGKRQRRTIDCALFQGRDSFRVAADLNQRHITIRIEPLLPENMANQKICEGTESGDADFFALEILNPFNLWFDDHRMDNSRKGVSEDDKIGTGKTGINDRGSRYRSDLNTAANHRLRGFPGTPHSHGIGIETILLEGLASLVT